MSFNRLAYWISLSGLFFGNAGFAETIFIDGYERVGNSGNLGGSISFEFDERNRSSVEGAVSRSDFFALSSFRDDDSVASIVPTCACSIFETNSAAGSYLTVFPYSGTISSTLEYTGLERYKDLLPASRIYSSGIGLGFTNLFQKDVGAVITVSLPVKMTESEDEPQLIPKDSSDDVLDSEIKVVVVQDDDGVVDNGTNADFAISSEMEDIPEIPILTSSVFENELANQIRFTDPVVRQSRVDARLLSGVAENLNDCSSYSVLDTSKWPQLDAARKEINNWFLNTNGDWNNLGANNDQSMVIAYFAMAFGAEGRFFLELPGVTEETEDMLSAISFVLDDESGDVALPGELLGSCSELVVWAALSGRDLDIRSVQEFRKKIDASPQPVIDALGRRLVQRFIEMGDQDTASFVLGLMSGSSEQRSGEYELSNIEVDRASGLESSSAVAGVIESDSDVAPLALAEAVNDVFEAGLEAEQTTVDRLEVYQQELAGGELGGELKVAQLKALLSRADFAEAFKIFESLGGSDENEEFQRLATALVGSIVGVPSDGTFTVTSLSIPASVRDRASSESIDELRERIGGLGFSELLDDAWSAVEETSVAENDQRSFDDPDMVQLEDVAVTETPSPVIPLNDGNGVLDPDNESVDELARNAGEEGVGADTVTGSLSAQIADARKVLQAQEDTMSLLNDLGFGD